MWDLERFKENTAVIDDRGNALSYAELKAYEKALCSHLKSRSLVMQFARNTLGSFIGYISFLDNKIVPIMVSTALNPDQKTKLINSYHPQYLWLPTEIRSEFADCPEVFSLYDYSLLKTDYPSDYELYPELALLLTTSGTTGSQKYVRQSYVNISSNAESIISYLKIDYKERAITSLPMHYTFGLSVINSHIKAGATILLTDKSIMQKEFWAFMKKYGATSISGVPYTYEMLKRLRMPTMELPSLKTLTQAGGKLSVELQKYFSEYARDTDRLFYVMYGQCEATSRMGYLPYDKSLDKLGSIGIPIPGGKYSLIDAEGRRIDKCHLEGELVYEGANVTLGYAHGYKDLYLGDERHGRLCTGDLAYFDEDNYFYITGRNNRFIKVFGNRVNLDEVQQNLKEMFSELDCAVIGRDDLIMVCMLSDNLSYSVKTFLEERLGLNHTAIQTRVVERIPKNEAGKILYHTLVNRLL
ncbi:Acyl-CoA synthetase (AMP-forming)/AMP-acid ligase II [Succinivibrio dextrinosolvens]|uniref:AMP-binding protein n=1 Tax=Succinivibrio dextrinosolvens TaxID=83771 RepID=UPI0008F0C366|nr:AMP-binding protein [Succinivibrio dextrinosolvens]SFS82356.1 Acyl-CoA synthetase (AMP-forming)/AMP-acid ligase II [Succinivibrio dextrinosolvens]